MRRDTTEPVVCEFRCVHPWTAKVRPILDRLSALLHEVDHEPRVPEATYTPAASFDRKTGGAKNALRLDLGGPGQPRGLGRRLRRGSAWKPRHPVAPRVARRGA